MSDTGRSDVVVSISIRTLLLVAGGVALASALASIGSALLMILVSVFSVAVLSPVASAMQRRLRWSRALCSTVLVLGIVIAIAVVVLVLVQAISDAVSGFSDDLPQILDEVRHSDLGDFINGGSGSLDTLREHASDITSGVGKLSGGVADVGVSAFGAVTLVLLGHLPDAVRAERRTARTRLDRGPDVPRQPGALPGRDESNRQHDLALHARQPRHLRGLRDGLRRYRGDSRSCRTRSPSP